MQEGVQVAVFETVVGGEYDVTNVLKSRVQAVTSVGLDHVRLLGPGLVDVAWEKGGIFKEGGRAFATWSGDESVRDVLEVRARERGARLEWVGGGESDEGWFESLGNVGARMREDLSIGRVRGNFKLGWKVVEDLLKGEDWEPLQKIDVQQAVEKWHWPGRFERIANDRYEWFLDGAHNEMSMPVVGEWIGRIAGKRGKDR